MVFICEAEVILAWCKGECSVLEFCAKCRQQSNSILEVANQIAATQM